jgi:hypothetical protein
MAWQSIALHRKAWQGSGRDSKARLFVLILFFNRHCRAPQSRALHGKALHSTAFCFSGRDA